jgi:hypothetical protein
MRHDVLCGCGWGEMGMKEEDIPHCCPVCGGRLICPDDYVEDEVEPDTDDPDYCG